MEKRSQLAAGDVCGCWRVVLAAGSEVSAGSGRGRRAMLMTHKYRGSRQSSRGVKPKFIDLTQGEPNNIYKP
jgi:hypothetical protein